MSIAVNDLAGAYRKLLGSIGVTPQSDDLLIQSIDGIDKQVLVEGKPLALPTSDIVNNYSDSIVLFHPLCENLLLGESPVLQEFRQLVMDFLNDLILKTIESVLCIAVDESVMAELSPTQVDFMRSTAGADLNTLKNWRAIMRRAESRGSSHRVITIFLKRGSDINGEMQKRVAIVNFNIYQELTSGNLQIFGTKIRKVDAKVYTKIFEAIFENIFTIDEYSSGSNALTAPYFDALVSAYHKVLKSINSVTWNLRKPIKQVNNLELHVKDEFMELFKDLMKYRDVLPTMPLNDGDRQTRREEDAKAKMETTNKPIPANELPGVSQLTRQSNPYYEPMTTVVTQEIEQPVNQPVYNQPVNPFGQPQQQQPPVVNNFPSLQEQLAGAPMGGYGNIPPQMHNNFTMPPGMQQGWGQPQQMQPQGWGQPQPQHFWNPQANQQFQGQQMQPQGWGQQQPMQQGWGQPQRQW